MIYKTILVDDEVLALRRLGKLLEQFSDSIEIVGTSEGGKDALKLIEKLKPDLLFLDIQMPEMNGFDLISKLSYQPLIIFATAYDKYALKAFDSYSIDYLMKPIDSARLEKSIAKLRNLRNENREELYNRLEQLIPKLNNPKLNWIQVRRGDRINLLDPNEIYFFEADEKYIRVYTYDRDYLISGSLSSLETDLGDNFVRIHRSSLINMKFIDEIFKMFNGSYKVRMKNKTQSELPVSRQSKHYLGLS